MKIIFTFLILLRFSAFAQTISDANLLQADISQILCGGVVREVSVPVNATDAMKRIATLDFAYQLANDGAQGFIQKKDVYPKIIPKLTAAAASGAGGWITFYSESGKVLLFSAIGCSPIDKFVKYVDGTSKSEQPNPYSDWSTEQPAAKNEACSVSNGNNFGFYLKDEECKRICEPGSHYVEEANKINGKFVPGFHDANNWNDQTVYAGCVRCDDPVFGGDSSHMITNDQSNGCYNMDDCEVGYTKRELRLVEATPTASSLWAYKNHDSLPQFSVDDQKVNAQHLADAALDGTATFIKKVCAEKCKDWQDIDENGNCASTYAKTCKTLKNYYDRLLAWDPKIIFNMSQITACSTMSLYDFIKQKKMAYLEKMNAAMEACRSSSKDIADAIYENLIFKDLTISNLMYFESYGQSPCTDTQTDQDIEMMEHASDEDYYTIRRPLLDILNEQP